MTDTPNPSQQQKKTGLQWRGKDFSFARPQSTTTTLPTSPTPNPHSPLSAPTTPVNNTPLGTQPHPLTPTQPEHTDTHAITPHLEQDTSRTLGPALTESKPIVNSLKSAPKQPSLPMTALPVYTAQPALHRAVVKSPTPVLHSPPTYPLTPPQPKTNTPTVMRPVVSPPLVSDHDRKRKADQMTAVNTPEVQYKRRVVQALQSDAKTAGQPALTPFLNCEDVLTRLLPFHIFQPVDSEALVEGTHEDEQQQRYQVLLEDYHARNNNNSGVSTSEEQLLMERLLWSEQREELHASRELLNKYLQQLQQQRQLQQQLLYANTAQVSTSNQAGPAVHSTPLSGGAVKVIATTPFTAPRNPPLNVAVMAPGMGKTGLLSAQTMALIQKVAHHNQSARPSVVTPVNVVPVPPSLSKDEHVINVLPQHKS